MKKIISSMITGALLILVMTGCRTDENRNTGGDVVESEDQTAGRTEAQTDVLSENAEYDDIPEAENAGIEKAAVIPENILNYEDALEEMVIARSEDRERRVVSFCDTFPEELQEAFRYEIEHYGKTDIPFGEYNTGLEWHALDEFPYEIPNEVSKENFAVGYDSQYQELDLDGDGESEYLFRIHLANEDSYDRGLVYKIVDGKPVLCFIQPTYGLGLESLSYEGEYYLYIGNTLIRCEAGCDLLSDRYEKSVEGDAEYYVPAFNGLANTYLEYIVGVVRNGEYSWHEGYRLKGYEGIDFKSYLPEGLENALPVVRIYNDQEWCFTAASERYYQQYSLPVEVEGKIYEYVFIRKEYLREDRDVIVAVLEPDGNDHYTIVCMYSLLLADEISLIDERDYIDEMVEGFHLVFDCFRLGVENESYEELLEEYQPDQSAMRAGYLPYQHKPVLMLWHEGRRAVAMLDGEEFKIIYDKDDARFIDTLLYPGILEHAVEPESGTESYLYYEIYNDVYDTRIGLKDSFIRVDEDGDGQYTEQDSYYCNGYELDQNTWDSWIEAYLNSAE